MQQDKKKRAGRRIPEIVALRSTRYSDTPLSPFAPDNTLRRFVHDSV